MTKNTLNSIDPMTGDVVGTVEVATPEAIADAVSRARAAQPAWRAMGVKERADILRAAGPKLVEQAEEIGEIIAREMGKPKREAIGEAKYVGSSLGSKIDDMIDHFESDVVEDDHTRSMVHHDPLGVGAVISPWNFPIAMPAALTIPSLMAGNTVVMKPSEETPLTAQRFAKVLQDCLPDGVLQIVFGTGEQGAQLVDSDIDFVAFTGSRETGKKILETCVGSLKRVILELGGKDPMIVLGDADLEKAARFATQNSFRNAGQVCVSTERIFVDSKVRQQFEDKLAEFAGTMTVGSALEDGTEVGPMASAKQRDKVMEQLDDARKRGARFVCGGGAREGNFVEPTVLADVPGEARVVRDETFGPVVVVESFESEDDAVKRANDTPFGLGAVVFGDPDHAATVARGLDAGMIGVNKGCGGAIGTPWVGAKQSGYGFRGGREGNRQFTQARVVSLPKKS